MSEKQDKARRVAERPQGQIKVEIPTKAQLLSTITHLQGMVEILDLQEKAAQQAAKGQGDGSAEPSG